MRRKLKAQINPKILWKKKNLDKRFTLSAFAIYYWSQVENKVLIKLAHKPNIKLSLKLNKTKTKEKSPFSIHLFVRSLYFISRFLFDLLSVMLLWKTCNESNGIEKVFRFNFLSIGPQYFFSLRIKSQCKAAKVWNARH